MVLCRFFLQGNCRYGESCKFEHDKGGNQWNFSSQQTYTSPLNLSSNPKPAQPVSNVETSTLVKSAVNDMTAAEKGGQWLLSSYAPFKERPGFPGFEDYSFEEVRLMYYEAMKNGLVEQYKQQWQNILQQAMMRIKALQNPTPDIAKTLETIYNTPPKSTTTVNSGSIFGGNQQPAAGTNTFSNVFGSAPTSNNIFGQNQSNTQNPQQQSGGSIFGSTPANTGLFSGGAKQQAFSGSVFGGTSQNTQNNQSSNIFNKPQNVFSGNVENKNLFGSTQPTNSVFGSSQTSSNSVFGNQQSTNLFAPQQNQGSTFGNAPTNVFTQQQQQQPNIFNQQQSVFNQQQSNVFTQQAPQQSNLFSGNTQPDSSNIFAAQKPMGSMFGGQANQQQSNNSPLFSQQQQTMNSNSSNLFQSQASSGDNSNQFFKSLPQSTSSSNSSNSIFGSTSNTVMQNTMNNPAIEISSCAYSKLEDLSEAEINWFKSDDLDMDNIPIKPPTREMCV